MFRKIIFITATLITGCLIVFFVLMKSGYFVLPAESGKEQPVRIKIKDAFIEDFISFVKSSSEEEINSYLDDKVSQGHIDDNKCEQLKKMTFLANFICLQDSVSCEELMETFEIEKRLKLAWNGSRKVSFIETKLSEVETELSKKFEECIKQQSDKKVSK